MNPFGVTARFHHEPTEGNYWVAHYHDGVPFRVRVPMIDGDPSSVTTLNVASLALVNETEEVRREDVPPEWLDQLDPES